MTNEQKQYAERDPRELDKAGGYYIRHVMAMTAEQLHFKSDIAAELGWRDMEIDRLRAELEKAQAVSVPPEKAESDYEHSDYWCGPDPYCQGHMDGWNQCRDAMLAASPEPEP